MIDAASLQQAALDMRLRMLASIIAIVVAGAQPAQAQTDKQMEDWCYGDSTDDQTVQGCNAVIEAKKVTNEDLSTAYANLGYAYDQKGQYDRAIESCNEAIRLNSNSAIAFVNRGLAYESLGQPDRAIADYDQAIRIKPGDATALNNRGLAYAATGNYERAIQDYDDALRINFDFAQAFYNRGIAKHKIGDVDDGDADIHTAKQLDPHVGP